MTVSPQTVVYHEFPSSLNDEVRASLDSARVVIEQVADCEDAVLRAIDGIGRGRPPVCFVVTVGNISISLQVFLQALHEAALHIPVVAVGDHRLAFSRELLLANLPADFPLAVCLPQEFPQIVAILATQQFPTMFGVGGADTFRDHSSHNPDNLRVAFSCAAKYLDARI